MPRHRPKLARICAAKAAQLYLIAIALCVSMEWLLNGTKPASTAISMPDHSVKQSKKNALKAIHNAQSALDTLKSELEREG